MANDLSVWCYSHPKEAACLIRDMRARSDSISKLNHHRAKKIDELREALKQLIDYVIDGCPDGSYIAVIEAKAALSNITNINLSGPAGDASASALPDDRSVSTRTLGCGEP